MGHPRDTEKNGHQPKFLCQQIITRRVVTLPDQRSSHLNILVIVHGIEVTVNFYVFLIIRDGNKSQRRILISYEKGNFKF